jgi:peptide deformylase
MAKEMIIQHPNEILLKYSDPMKEGDKLCFLGMMQDAMKEHKGVGISAVQVGVLKRAVVIQHEDKNLVLINPIITNSTGIIETQKEGCLSYPGLLVPIERPNGVWVHWQNIESDFQSRWFYGMSARVVQHEIDHLEGKTIYQQASHKNRKRWEHDRRNS